MVNKIRDDKAVLFVEGEPPGCLRYESIVATMDGRVIPIFPQAPLSINGL